MQQQFVLNPYISQHYSYQLIPDFSFELRRHSIPLAINSSNTMVYANHYNNIVVFQLINGLRQLQQVKNHIQSKLLLLMSLNKIQVWYLVLMMLQLFYGLQL
ncbi:unnamed protein product (macronuclear) [Paramecium tetraurelia]|uniref:Uncharacterized protein n=1 Tax=Paramecium tetraurelia TaxID=5888 RepID=A0CI20_PARTE|nr:uncharacterized protein GSPATT00038541001 [Paramecium tetraurelia]CAK70437.1 unnamed protein product [Paramecium tetraurelia]|eukprot:XP_001437834.1 hypothetical protein (macronuclear) [Paramecium tetraurelia strain d4-2]